MLLASARQTLLAQDCMEHWMLICSCPLPCWSANGLYTSGGKPDKEGSFSTTSNMNLMRSLQCTVLTTGTVCNFYKKFLVSQSQGDQ